MNVNLLFVIYTLHIIYVYKVGIYMLSLHVFCIRIRNVSPREQAKCHKTLFHEFHFI